MPLYRTKQDIAYLTIKDWILHGTLAPGERVTIREVAAKIGISETPVRAALTRLEAEGLLDHTSHVSATVTPVRLEDIADAQRVIGVLQGISAERAATRASTEEIAGLEAILAELEALTEDASTVEFAVLNFKFHRAITQISGYSLIEAFQDQLFEKVGRARMLWAVPAHREKARQEHRDVFTAIQRRQPGEARVLMERHWARSQEDFVAQMAAITGAPAPNGRVDDSQAR